MRLSPLQGEKAPQQKFRRGGAGALNWPVLPAPAGVIRVIRLPVQSLSLPCSAGLIICCRSDAATLDCTHCTTEPLNHRADLPCTTFFPLFPHQSTIDHQPYLTSHHCFSTATNNHFTSLYLTSPHLTSPHDPLLLFLSYTSTTDPTAKCLPHADKPPRSSIPQTCP